MKNIATLLCMGVVLSWTVMTNARSADEVLLNFDDPATELSASGWQLWIESNRGQIKLSDGGYMGGRALSLAGVKSAVAQYDVQAEPAEVIAFEILCRKVGSGVASFRVMGLNSAKRADRNFGITQGRFRPFEDDWQKAQIKVIVPQGAVGLQITLSVENQTTGDDRVWFDDLKISRDGKVALTAASADTRAPQVQTSLNEADYARPASVREAIHTMRMSILKHCDVEGNEVAKMVTPDRAAEYAKQLRKDGYNIVLTEGQRYLMSDSRDHAPFPDVLNNSLPFPELLSNTKAIVEACRAEGLKVFLHLTAALTSKEMLTKHPEYMALSVNNGKPSTIWGLEWMCLNNPDLQNEYFKRLEQLVRETRVDGLMVDETSMMFENCGCHFCRAKFAADNGMPMPPQGAAWFGDRSNPVYRTFLRWRLQNGVDYNERILQILRKYNPEAELLSYYALPHNPTAWNDHGISVETAGMTSRPIGLEMISNYPKFWPLFIANMKIVRSVAEHNDGDVFVITNPQSYDAIYRHWLMSLSQGAHQYWAWYIPESVKKERASLVQWEMKNQNLLAGLRTAAQTAVVISSNNNNLHRFPLGSINLQNSYFAVANTLTMGHMPFKAFGDKDLDQPLTGKANTLIALNLGLISDAEGENIRRFVEEGGTLVAGLDFSLYDEQGEKRKNFALADLLGADYLATFEGDAVLDVTERNSLLGGVTGEFASQDVAVSVKPHADTRVLGTIKLADGRMLPGILTRSVGKGQVIYFAGHIEPLLSFNTLNGNQIFKRSYGDNRDLKFEQLFLSLVRNISNEKVKVSNLPYGVVLEVYEQNFKGASHHVVSLLNHTGLLTDGRPEASQYTYPDLKNKLPDPNQPIRISLKGSARRAFALSPDFEGEKELVIRRSNDETIVEIPSFANFLNIYFVQ